MKFKIILISLILIMAVSAVYGENETNTFADVQTAIDSDSLIIYLNNTEYIGDGKEIIINRDVVLDGGYNNGEGTSTLNANGLSRIFTITSNNSVILKNINLINGNTNENGGAIFFNSTGQLGLYFCTFTNNTANDGGSVYTTEGSVISIYSNFINNSCLENGEAIFSQNTFPEMIYTDLNTDSVFTHAKLLEESDTLIDSEVEIHFGKNEFGFIGDDNYTLLMYKPLYNGTFPERFDLREYGYVGPVRHQGTTGTCWAHTIIGALESSILKASNGTFMDKNEGLSIANMIDIIRKYVAPIGYANNGAHFTEASSYFISWIGPTYDSNAPFLGYYVEPTIYPNIVHVQNILTIRSYNMTAIKQALMDYGGLYGTAAVQNPSGFGANNYYPKYLKVDHAMLLVGWDDNYSRYKFNPVNGEYPPGDGAWIVKNSWGENWAYNGYCYISYYDGTFLRSFEDIFGFIFNDTIRFNKNYQHTITGRGSSFSDYEDTIADNFTIADDDYLAAFSTYFNSKCNYTASIYVNNNLVLTQTGTHDLVGYFTIELDKYIPLKKGDLLTISIKFSSLTDEPYSVYETSARVPFVRGFTSRALIESIQNRIGYANSGDEIFLNNKTYYSSEGEKTILINKNITINGAKSNGEGFSTIDATYLNTVFEIANGCSLTLKNVNIINSKSTAIIVNEKGIANILNCNFTNNVGENGNSIAVYGEATIKNCIINNKNSGIGEIYVEGKVNLENNKINSNAAGIYNKGIINTETNLVFNDITSYVNVPTKITASLTDDNRNTINSDSNVNLNNFGQMTFEGQFWIFEYIPTTTEEKVLTGSINFRNLKIQNGLLTVNANAPLLITDGTFSYGYIANVRLTLRTDKLGLYDVYVDNTKIKTYSATSPVSTISLPQMTVGTHTIRITSISDSSYSNTATLKIVPAEVDLEVKARNINYGEQSTIEVTLKDKNNQPLDGSVKVTLCEKTYNLNLVNGKARFNITERYAVNEYSVIATFEGNTNYLPSTAQTTMRVSKITPKFEITVENFYTDELGLCTITFDESVTGLVELHATPYKLSNAYFSDGKLIYYIRMTENGPREFYFDYHGNENYHATKSQSVYFYVMERGNLEIIGGTFDYGSNVNITLITPETGDIDIYVDGNKKGRYSASSTKLTIDLLDLSCGTHTIKAEYVDDTSKTCERTVTINKVTPNLTITTNNPQNSENLIIYLELTDANDKGINGEITLNFDGQIRIVYLTNGKGSVELFEKLNAGDYLVTAKFDGNTNYNDITTKQTITIAKLTPTLTLDIENIEYGDTFTVTANINTDATGTITFYIDNVKSENIPILNGKAKYIQDNLNIGEHEIYAIYNGDNNYRTIITTTLRFNVIENANIYIKGGKFEYGNTPYVFVKTSIQTDVDVYINTLKIGTYTSNPNGLQINLPISDVGTYDIYVEYAGDSSKNSTTNVEIQKIAPKITIISDNINYGEVLKIDVDLKGANNEPLTGDILLIIGEKTYPLHITNGKGTIEINDSLDAKTYSIIASFSEEDNYKSTSVQKTVTISKLNPTISVITENLDINSPFTAIATISSGATGTVEFYLDNNNIGSSQINNDEARFILTTLESGTHTLYAKYVGNTNYNPATSTVIGFSIESQGAITITAEDIEYGETAYVTIKTSEDTTVNVYVDSKKIGTYSVSTTGTKITLPQLTMGSHTIKAECANNIAINSQTTMEVLRIKPILKLDVLNANYRASFEIAIEVSGIPAEDLVNSVISLNAKINNIPYPIILMSGKGSITVYELLNAGDYVVSVTFPGSGSYQSVTAEKILTIYPIDPEITIETNNVKYGETLVVTTSIKNEATGYIDLYVDGEKVGSENIANNQAKFNINNLQAGNHQIYAHYSGDINYNEYITPITSITLNSQGSLTVIGGTFKPTEDTYITIRNSQTSNVNVYVDGGKIGTYLVNTDGIELNLGKLTIGNHNIKVEYSNDITVTSQTTVEIQKITPTITLTAEEIESGETFTAVATVSNAATGSVDFYIDGGKVGTSQLVNGKAEYKTTTLTDGQHTIYAIYNGDSNNNIVTSITKTFNVIPQGTISVTGGTYRYGEKAYVVVESNKDSPIKLYVNDNLLGTFSISNSERIELPTLSVGTYTIIAEYADDRTINNQTTVEITKTTPTITLTAEEVEYGETFTAIATVSNGVTGNVEFYIDDVKVETVEITNGKAIFVTDQLSEGSHTIYAKYVGNNNYYESETSTLSFDIESQARISIIGSDFTTLEEAYVIIETNKMAELNVYVDNVKLGTYTILSDTLNVPISNLNAGTHTIKVEYLENPSIYAETTVNITKVTPTITIIASDVVSNIPVPITIESSDKINGTVEIYLNNAKYGETTITNGISHYHINNLAIGQYSIYAKYLGNDKYTESTSNTDEFNVNEIHGLFVIGEEFEYLTTPYITIYSTKNTTVNLYINNVLTKTITIGKDTNKLDLPITEVGNYAIKIEDTNDSTLSAETTVEIIKTTTNIDLTVGNNIYGENTAITALLNNNTSGTVDIYINNEKVDTVQINNGKIEYSTKLNAGEYSIYVAYNGDENFESATSDIKTFSIMAKETQLSITADKFVHNQNGTITVKILPEDTVGRIILTIDNNRFTKEIIDGVAIFNVNLTAGKHLIKAMYEGSTNYGKSEINETIDVEKLNGEMTHEVIINNKGNVKINVNIPENDNNNVFITVNNQKIPVEINKGKGTVNLGILNAGEYNYKIEYEGEYYDVENIENKFIVPEKDQTFSLTTKDLTMYYKDGSKVVATLKDSNNKAITGKKVVVLINGEYYNRTTDKNGQASVALNLNPGTYAIKFIYNNTTVTSNVVIKSTVVGNDIVKYYKNDTQYVFKILDSKGRAAANQKVQLNINGVFYDRTTDSQGMAKMNINLNPGTYTITVMNLNNLETSSNNITVLSKIKANDLVKYFCNDSQYEIQIVDNTGKAVANQKMTLNINGVFYERTTNAQGMAKMNINLGVGKYTVTVMCEDSIFSNNITVLSKIKASNIVMSKDNRQPFKITTLDNNGKAISGKVISFNINGMIYNRTTDKNGNTQLNINLNPGEYIITTTYEKQITSNKVTVMG